MKKRSICVKFSREHCEVVKAVQWNTKKGALEQKKQIKEG